MLVLASVKKQVFGWEYLLVRRLLAHLAKLAQWLVQKALLEVNAPRRRLERVSELHSAHIPSGCGCDEAPLCLKSPDWKTLKSNKHFLLAQQESENLFLLVPKEMKLLDNSHLDYSSQMNLAQASDLSGSAWNLTLQHQDIT